MRKLYGNGDPGLFRRLARLPGVDDVADEADTAPPGIAAGSVDALVERLSTDGFVVLDRLLDEATCSDLEAVARAAQCALIGPEGPLPGRQRFDERDPRAIRYDLAEADILRSAAAQRLVADASLLDVARRYLGVTPVQDLVAMWWSTSVGATASAAAAQQFHFDLDRLAFLKVFVFLTDVDEATGPHVYVRGSHRRSPAALRHDGRHGDDAVAAAFGDDIVTITGPRGTVFLADTIGLHKGKNLERGHRLVFQTEYATSLFGAPYDVVEVADPVEELAAAAARHPHTFERFRLGR